MSDRSKPTDNSEQGGEKKVVLAGHVSTDVNAKERDDALSLNPNKSDGSLQKYADRPIARSIEIHAIDLDGKPVKIDKNSIHKERSLNRQSLDQSDSEAKTQRQKHERISRSVMLLAYEAKQNPVMQPVQLAREYADKLPDEHPDKQKLTEMARHQAAEFSPNMRSFYQQQDAQLVVAGTITPKEQVRELKSTHAEKPLENNFEGWQKLAQKIANLAPDQQFKLVTNLIKEQQAIDREKAIGALVGTVQGTESLVMDACNFFQFAGECLIYPDKANAKIEKFCGSLWNAGVAGVQLLEVGALYGAAYTGEVIMSADASKPLKDAYKLGQFLEKEWDKKTPFEKERLKHKFATEVLGNMIPIGTSAKLAKAGTVAEILKVITTEARAHGGNLEKGAKALTNFINEVTRFGKAWAPVGHAEWKNPGIVDQIKDIGKGIKDKIDEISAQMGHHKPDKPPPIKAGEPGVPPKESELASAGKKGKGKHHYEDQGPPEGYKYWRPRPIDILHLKEHPFVKDVLEKVAKEGKIRPEDGKKVCDVIAESLRSKCADIDYRNIAFGVLTKNGKQTVFIGISKKEGLPGIVGESLNPVLPTKRAGDIDVRLHSEYKILETVRKLLEKEPGGAFALFTEQKPCRSCDLAIEAFKGMFNGKPKSKGKVDFGEVTWKYEKKRTREDWNLLRTNWQ